MAKKKSAKKSKNKSLAVKKYSFIQKMRENNASVMVQEVQSVVHDVHANVDGTEANLKTMENNASNMVQVVKFATNINATETLVGESNKEKDIRENGIAGFIFMCSRKTKPECYQFRVFGLPEGKLEVVEKIRKGTKLFLFDFNLKLLYGIYKASSLGGNDLEPDAFDGAFPAQVRFKIFKECIPLPESVFSHAFRENYDRKGKFKPELSHEQVNRLAVLFRQIPAPQLGLSSPAVKNQQWESSQPPLVSAVSHGRSKQVPAEDRPDLSANQLHHASVMVSSEYSNMQPHGASSHSLPGVNAGHYGLAVSAVHPVPDSYYVDLPRLHLQNPYRVPEYLSQADVYQPYIPRSVVSFDPYSRYRYEQSEMISRDPRRAISDEGCMWPLQRAGQTAVVQSNNVDVFHPTRYGLPMHGTRFGNPRRGY